MAQISLNLPDLEAERISLGEFLARPDAYSASDFTAKNKRFSELEVLIEKAKELLSTTNLSVSEIAYSLGFEFPQSFNKLFKNKTQVSPMEFRQSFR